MRGACDSRSQSIAALKVRERPGTFFRDQRWRFTDGDFEAIRLAEDDFVYADPPYDVEFTRYAREAFGWEDQVRLADHPGPVLLSNQATDRVVRLYRKTGFRLRFLDAPRRISCNGDRRPAPEVLASRGVLSG